jgi:hypothetical protein
VQGPRRQWLTVKSDSFEAFAWFLVEIALAVIALVAAGRWALGAELHEVPVSGGLAAGVAGGVHAVRRWSTCRSDDAAPPGK